MALRSVDSTNAMARRILAAGAAPGAAMLLVTAWEQLDGRGRRGNRWQSAPGAGVYATVALALPDGADASILPLLAAVAVCERIDRHVEPPCRIKWPNDLLVGGRKIGGLLLESLPAPRGRRTALIGFGVNLRDPEGVPRATSLARHTRRPPDAAELTVELAAALQDRLDELQAPERAVAAFRALSAHRPGDRLSYRDARGAVRSGEFRGLDERGYLRLGRGGTETVVAAAELVE